MLVLNEQRHLVAEGVQAKREFGFELGPHLMTVLSSLYSDIPRAIVREYLANAGDGYARLPKGAPFVPPLVHLPNTLEPFFRVRDYGCGMDFDTVWNVFSTYGASLKRGDNVEVGGFGLGSKTAFCYADQWTVTSYFEGERHVFAAMKDERGMPSLVHLVTEPTDEPNGVDINIPTRQQDSAAFARAATSLLPYFPMDVNVIGLPNFTLTKPEYFIRGSTWGIQKSRDYQGSATVIMGGVPYPVADTAVAEHFRSGALRGASLDLYVPIGAVTITPSREALQYTPHTQEGLRQAVETFKAELPQIVEKQLAACTTAWEALGRIYGTWNSGFRSYIGGITWRGRALDPQRGLEFDVRELRQRGLEVVCYANDGTRAVISRDDLADFDTKDCLIHGIGKASRTIAFEPGKLHVVVLVNDTLSTSQRDRRIRQYCWDKLGVASGRAWTDRYIRLYLVTWPGHVPGELSAVLDGIPVVSSTELPEPSVKSAQAREWRITKLKVLRRGWDDADVDVANGGWFVPLHKDKSLSGYYPGTLTELWDAAKVLGFVRADEQLFGIPRSRKAVGNKPGWHAFEPYLNTMLSALRNNGEEIRLLSLGLTWTPDTPAKQWVGANIGSLVLSRRAVVRRFAERVQHAEQQRKRAEAMRRLCHLLQLQPPFTEQPKALNNAWAQVLARYPLLHLIRAKQLSSPEQRAVLDYLGVPPTVENVN